MVQHSIQARRRRVCDPNREPPKRRMSRVFSSARWARARQLLPVWACQWQFWLVLGLASLLRVPPAARSPFSSDDALLFLEAARALHDHLLPGTGIFNSLLALNMPFYTWLLLPFALNPLGMAILTDTANILAVGGLYIFGDRYFGRVAGFVAALLCATAMYPTWMSLFSWQQTLVPPLVLAALFTLFLGAVDGKRHWLPFHTLILAALIQIYPLTVTLLPLTFLGIWLGRRAIVWLVDLPLALIGPILLFLPTYLFEKASGGYDIRVYEQFLRAPVHVDTQVFALLQQAIGALPPTYLGTPTFYAEIAPHVTWLGTLLLALWAVSTLWLIWTIRIPHPGDRGWRARFLLVVWPPVFLAVTVRHSSPIYIHYVFILLPIAYLTIGLALAELPYLLGLAGGLLGGGVQLIATGSFILVLVTGQATGASWGGIPITNLAEAMTVAEQAAVKMHAGEIYIISDPGDPYMGLYWAERQNQLDQGDGMNWTSYTNANCALTPPPGTGPGIMLVMSGSGLAVRELVADPGTELITSLNMARGVDYSLYKVAPSDPATGTTGTIINGELQVDGATLEPAQYGLPPRIVIRWTVLHSSLPGPAISEYFFHFLVSAPHTSHTTSLPTYQAKISCTPGSWVAGEGIVVTVPLPTGYGEASQAALPSLRVIISRDTHTWYQPRAGSLVLETAKELNVDPILLPPGSREGPGITAPIGPDYAHATISIQLRR